MTPQQPHLPQPPEHQPSSRARRTGPRSPAGAGAGAGAGASADAARERAVGAALARLDLDAKARLLAGQDMWTLPALSAIGLGSLVMSDGPIGVRGRRWSGADPSVALPSPSALAATWDPALARRAGRLLAQEAHRKGVHVLLAPTVNLHRSPLGGRHFEAYSEDPYLTGEIGTEYVCGVQDGGVGATVKHFVGNDAETERFTVDNRIPERALRELYLAPFEAVVRRARPWGVMAAYNAVNGARMTEHGVLLDGVLRGEWGFDGVVVSDWFAARSTTGAIRGGLDLAMPGPDTVYGPALAAAVRAGEVDERLVDDAARRVLRLAARAGLLSGAPAAVPPAARPPAVDGPALAREIAARSFVLLRNEPPRAATPSGAVPGVAASGVAASGRPGAGGGGAGSVGADGPGTGGPAGVAAPERAAPVLPLDLSGATAAGVVVIGGAAREPRVMGGGSAEVFPGHVVSPLDGLRRALPAEVPLSYAHGAEPGTELAPAAGGFELRAVARDEQGAELGAEPLPGGQVLWLGGGLPEGVVHERLHTVEVCGRFVPRVGGAHRFGTRGTGGFRLAVAGRTLFDGTQADAHDDPFEAFFGAPTPRGTVQLAVGEPVDVSLTYTLPPLADRPPMEAVGFALLHGEPERDPEELLIGAEAAARDAHTAVVVVATTERVESEGFDRPDLRLPGRQDELVARVAAANPRTVVVVNAGAPVEMPWREDVAAVLLAWFPGQEAGTALARVLLGAEEPGGRLPTTWPARLADAPVTRVTPSGGVLRYDEGELIGYRAWQARGPAAPAPAFCFGHGLGYTAWAYESLVVAPGEVEDGVTPGAASAEDGDPAPGVTAAGADRPTTGAAAAGAGGPRPLAAGGGDLACVRVRLRNTGSRAGREVVQLYLAAPGLPRRLAAFTSVTAEPGGTVEAVVRVPRTAARVWDERASAWAYAPGPYTLQAAHSSGDVRLTAEL